MRDGWDAGDAHTCGGALVIDHLLGVAVRDNDAPGFVDVETDVPGGPDEDVVVGNVRSLVEEGRLQPPEQRSLRCRTGGLPGPAQEAVGVSRVDP